MPREHVRPEFYEAARTHYPSQGEDWWEVILNLVDLEIEHHLQQGQSGSILAALRRLEEKLNVVESNTKKIMVTQDVLQKSVDSLKAAVDAAIAALPPNTPASTPDSSVLQFQANVDAQTARLVAAESTVVPTPAPAAKP